MAIEMTKAELKQAIIDGRVKNVPQNVLEELGLSKPVTKKENPLNLFDNIGDIPKLKSKNTQEQNQSPIEKTINPNISKTTQNILQSNQVKKEPWEQYYQPRKERPLDISFSPAPVINKAYKKKMEKILTEAKKINDPDLQAKALEAIQSGARWTDIYKAVALLKYNDRVRTYNEQAKQKAMEMFAKRDNKLKGSISLTRDRRKIQEKTAALAGAFATSADAIEYLADNYDSHNVGWFDHAIHSIAKPLNLADEKTEAFYQMHDSLLPDFKTLKHMGANFTESEQKMLRNIMPDPSTGDNLYLPNLLGFTVRLRNEIKNKLNSIDDANYDVGKLKKVVDRYDNIIAKLKTKVPKEIADSYKIDTTPISTQKQPQAPQGFVSQAKRANTQNPSPNTAKVISKDNLHELDALLGE